MDVELLEKKIDKMQHDIKLIYDEIKSLKEINQKIHDKLNQPKFG